MPCPPRHSPAATLAALRLARGNVSDAARRLGVTRQALAARIARTPHLARALAAIQAAQPIRVERRQWRSGRWIPVTAAI